MLNTKVPKNVKLNFIKINDLFLAKITKRTHIPQHLFDNTDSPNRSPIITIKQLQKENKHSIITKSLKIEKINKLVKPQKSFKDFTIARETIKELDEYININQLDEVNYTKIHQNNVKHHLALQNFYFINNKTYFIKQKKHLKNMNDIINKNPTKTEPKITNLRQCFHINDRLTYLVPEKDISDSYLLHVIQNGIKYVKQKTQYDNKILRSTASKYLGESVIIELYIFLFPETLLLPFKKYIIEHILSNEKNKYFILNLEIMIRLLQNKGNDYSDLQKYITDKISKILETTFVRLGSDLIDNLEEFTLNLAENDFHFKRYITISSHKHIMFPHLYLERIIREEPLIRHDVLKKEYVCRIKDKNLEKSLYGVFTINDNFEFLLDLIQKLDTKSPDLDILIQIFYDISLESLSPRLREYACSTNFENNVFNKELHSLSVKKKLLVKQIIKLQKEEPHSEEQLEILQKEHIMIKRQFTKLIIEKKLYDKIKGRKYYLHSFFSLGLIYKRFHIFIINGYLSYTGRFFYYSYGLDPSNKLARFILNLPYDSKPKSHTESTDPSVNVTNPTINYLVDLIKNNTVAWSYINTLNKYKQFNLRIPHIRWLLNRNINCYNALRFASGVNNYMKHREFPIELDASNSGLQCISLLFKDKQAGLLCYLNTSAKEDLYTNCINMFKKHIHTVTEYLKNHNKEHLKSILSECKYLIHNQETNLSHYDKYIFNKTISLNNYINENFNDLLRIFINTVHIYNKFLTRDLFKKALMTSYYGISKRTMKLDFLDFLENTNNTYTDFANLFTYYLAEFAVYYKEHYMPLYNEYLQIWSHIKDEHFSFSTNTYTWRFTSTTIKKFKVNLSKQSVKLHYRTNTFNKTQFKRKLPPIFIHAIDSYILHQLILKCKKHHIYYHLIHDCFIINNSHILKLRTILQEIYTNIFNKNILHKVIKQTVDPVYIKKFLAYIKKPNDKDYLVLNFHNKFIK